MGRTIDLHIHSTASDGTLQPNQIIDLSVQSGLSAISLTDHDSIDGCRQIVDAGVPPALDFLTGVEISAAFPPEIPLPGSLHILGYAIDINSRELDHHLKKQQVSRNQRSPKIIQRLNELGIPVTMEEVIILSGGDQVGRPHIARALKAGGWVASVDEAFDKYLGKSGPAYIEKTRLACDQTLALIRNANGIPVLAHPGLIRTQDDRQLEKLLNILIDNGLRGIEVFYPEHSETQVAFYNTLANRYSLLRTGGSDFHGDLNPQVKLGTGTGTLSVDYALYAALVAETKTPQPAASRHDRTND